MGRISAINMKLTGLICFHTKVSDLSPLKGMQLTELKFDATQDTGDDQQEIGRGVLEGSEGKAAGKEEMKATLTK